MDPEPGCQVAEAVCGRTGDGLDLFGLLFMPAAPGKDLGQHDQGGTPLGGQAHERFGLGQILFFEADAVI